MTDDEITQAFERLSPEDLMRTTTAKEVSHDPEALGFTFPGFCAEEQDRAVMAYKQLQPFPDRGDWFVATAVLESETERREFGPEPDETAGAYMRRLRREAHEMDARRFAVSMLTSAAYTPKGGSLPDVDTSSGDSVRAAIARGELSQHLVVYTEQRGARAALVGYPVSEDGTLGPMQTGRAASPLFASVLGDARG
jgi:hypothetical protein